MQQTSPKGRCRLLEYAAHPPGAGFYRIVIARELAGEPDIIAVARVHARDVSDLVIAAAVILRGRPVAVGTQSRRPWNDTAGVVAVDAVNAPDFRMRGGREQGNCDSHERQRIETHRNNLLKRMCRHWRRRNAGVKPPRATTACKLRLGGRARVRARAASVEAFEFLHPPSEA